MIKWICSACGMEVPFGRILAGTVYGYCPQCEKEKVLRPGKIDVDKDAE